MGFPHRADHRYADRGPASKAVSTLIAAGFVLAAVLGAAIGLGWMAWTATSRQWGQW